MKGEWKLLVPVWLCILLMCLLVWFILYSFVLAIAQGADKILIPNYYGFEKGETDGSYTEEQGGESIQVIPNNGIIDFTGGDNDERHRADEKDVPWKK